MTLFERILAWYLLIVSILAGAFGLQAPGQQPLWSAAYLVIHAGLLAAVLCLPRAVRDRSAGAALWIRGGFTVVALPVVFQSLALVLPGIHPEPYELQWIAADRALLGVDPTVALQPLLTPLWTELLLWCYSTFYLLPIVLIVTLLLQRRFAAAGAALLTILFGFLASYIGYLIWPTLPPYRFLWHEAPLDGVLLAATLHGMLDQAELNRWDCFPSGHTMLTLVTLWLAWRHARRLFWGLLPVGIGLVFSTVALRYHYVIDVLAGTAGAALTVPFVDWLQRIDAVERGQVN